MDYATSERNPVKHFPSIAMVVLLHIAIGYALVTGLARKVVEVMKQPLETKIIEEIKKPLPDVPPPPPPKLAPPPPPFIPPPEINIQAPIQQAPTITTVTTAPPPPAPPAPIVQPAPPAPPKALVRKEYKAIDCPKPTFPRQALQQGLQGEVTAHVHVSAGGAVTDVKILKSTNAMFNREVIRALTQCRFVAEGIGFIGEYEIIFNLKD